MEYWDIYDENRAKTGRVMAREDWHFDMQPGDYHLSVICLVEQRATGRILITQRKEDKAWAAGWWELPGGGVQAGEEPLEAAIRETREETGIDVAAAGGERVFTYSRATPEDHNNYFMDVYRFEADFGEADVRIQADEVAGWQLATVDDIRALGAQGIFLHYDSIRTVFDGKC